MLAGPGTGKTFALMRRILRLIQTGVAPDKILVSTFTRTAAKDLERELRRLGAAGIENVRAGTLHALCFSILNQVAVLAITNRTPRPLMDFETRFLLQDLSGSEFGGVRACNERLLAFNAAWARLQSDDPGWLKDDTDRRFSQELMRWLSFHKAMLIGELIPVTLSYLRNNPNCQERTQFQHVLVDEYQDLNRAEQLLLDLLASNGSLTVIGDENQSIYAFKYAHPEGIVEFGDCHANTLDENLSECRRCPKIVVQMANALILNSTSQSRRQLVPFPNNPEGEVHIIQWQEMGQEADGLARFIQSRVASGSVSAGSVLVLAPRRQFGYAIRNALRKLQVPAHSFFNEEELDGNPKELAECSAQEMFTLLCLLVDPDDRVALRCWCGFGSDSLRQVPWAKLMKRCSETGQSPRELLEQIAAGNATLPRSKQLVERFNLLKQRLASLAGLSGQRLVDALYPDGQDWAEPFRALAGSIGQPDYDALALVQHLRSGITQPELPTDVDYVRVMSLHKSKGLTADLVVVTGLLEGLMPHIDQNQPLADQEKALEEQRRLFYVAITRCRQTLVLSNVNYLPRDQAHKMRAKVGRGGTQSYAPTIASRFFDQLGNHRPSPVSGQQFLSTTLPAQTA
ncbi:MAG: ATP-dependent helicase [Verrucomicrobia bacterium]|nr:ATP-dependent helicase [Verrucomicrobiota bacterium]